jgi:hypothetical protein
MANRQTPSSDGSTAPQDVPPKTPTEEDITNKPGAIEAVRPDVPVEDLEESADYVEYKGKATTRRITAEQWEKVRVKDQSEVVWDASTE